MIDKNSPIPIYFQIEENIKRLIHEQSLQPGDSIPSEREFSDMFNVSRMTVRQAIQNLVSEGLLYREKGKGTFIAHQKIQQPLEGLTSFTEDMKKRGMTPGNRLLHFRKVQVKQSIAEKLKLELNEQVYEIERIRLADETPMAFETLYLPVSLLQDLPKEILHHSLYQYIEKLGLTIGNAQQIIEASTATEREANILGIEEEAPVLKIERQTFLKNGQPLEVVRSIYRSDRYQFVTNMKRI
ncbi:GntR family transcriptional regulator [Salirhabdus salicampi]|uniref:GntR family transcriptional regulator n=1 Tax=Salirhabdus salicampi TaxID=476102 RepID=UPI0020C4B993|nr:GntR family transcriptional regulator [Salirhabdus salicampi]MCP8617332.1 GntR family transcriptional regulator [Salirhabdus salicampi]